MLGIKIIVCEKDGQPLFPSSDCGFTLSEPLKPLSLLLHVIPTLMLR